MVLGIEVVHRQTATFPHSSCEWLKQKISHSQTGEASAGEKQQACVVFVQ